MNLFWDPAFATLNWNLGHYAGTVSLASMNSPALETSTPDTENSLNSSFSIDPKQNRPTETGWLNRHPACRCVSSNLVVITLEN